MSIYHDNDNTQMQHREFIFVGATNLQT